MNLVNSDSDSQIGVAAIILCGAFNVVFFFP